MENFLRRLDIYTNIPPTTAMTEILVKILIELLSTLALGTQQIKQGRLSKHAMLFKDVSLLVHRSVEKLGKKILGENDVEAVLQRLDRLNQEEVRTTTAQILEVVYGLFKNMRVVMDGAEVLIYFP